MMNNNSEDLFKQVIDLLKKQQPAILDRQKQADAIMQRIHTTDIKKTFPFYLWIWRYSIAALLFLSALFLIEEFSITPFPENTIPDTTFVKIKTKDMDYLITKHQERQNIKQLINHFHNENNN